MSEKFTNESINNLEKILEKYNTKESIKQRKELVYKNHYECKDEKWTNLFLLDYETDLYRQIRFEKCIRKEYS